ncbi:MAG: hypothetical protein EA419_07970 [Wenzhouxiangella sp.]|nr:MAG: hypothetical protein EA419_07970 [Wenzhouxiangella sp.]
MVLRYSVVMDTKACLRSLLILFMVLVLSGCATYFQPRYGSDGVYFDQARTPPRAVVAVDPLIYPYWSLDYFYFSRFYHPHSVFMHYHDPWFYPYPGWYYGYRPGPRAAFAFGSGFYYPWYSFGVSYSSYRPWWPAHGTYRYAGGYPVVGQPGQRVREIDQRLRLMERQPQRTAIRTQPASPPLRSEAMLRHRIAEDRAAAGARSRPASTRQGTESPRPASTRTPPPSRESRTEPARTRPATRPAPRERQQPPSDSGIDLSAFQRTPTQRPTAAPESSPEHGPASPVARPAQERPQQDRPITPSVRPSPPPAPPPAPVRERPETRPAPSVRPPPAPRQSVPPPTRSRDAVRSTRQREGDR